MRNAFLRRCNAIWSARGYPRCTGHSFRLGGTTELLLAGVHPDIVKAMGQWSSDAFLVYWHSLGDLAPCMLPTSGPAARSYHYPLYTYVSQIGACSTFWKTRSCSHPPPRKILSSHHPFINCLMSCRRLSLQTACPHVYRVMSHSPRALLPTWQGHSSSTCRLAGNILTITRLGPSLTKTT
jgi:hypothetical protein